MAIQKLKRYPVGRQSISAKNKPHRLKCTTGNFQCGARCTPIQYRNSKGATAYTNCRKNSTGMAKSGLDWIKNTQSRIEGINQKRGEKGKASIYLDKDYSIKKAQSNSTKAVTLGDKIKRYGNLKDAVRSLSDGELINAQKLAKTKQASDTLRASLAGEVARRKATKKQEIKKSSLATRKKLGEQATLKDSVRSLSDGELSKAYKLAQSKKSSGKLRASLAGEISRRKAGSKPIRPKNIALMQKIKQAKSPQEAFAKFSDAEIKKAFKVFADKNVSYTSKIRRALVGEYKKRQNID